MVFAMSRAAGHAKTPAAKLALWRILRLAMT